MANWKRRKKGTIQLRKKFPNCSSINAKGCSCSPSLPFVVQLVFMTYSTHGRCSDDGEKRTARGSMVLSRRCHSVIPTVDMGYATVAREQRMGRETSWRATARWRNCAHRRYFFLKFLQQLLRLILVASRRIHVLLQQLPGPCTLHFFILLRWQCISSPGSRILLLVRPRFRVAPRPLDKFVEGLDRMCVSLESCLSFPLSSFPCASNNAR